jgi:6-phosphogluconolactonase
MTTAAYPVREDGYLGEASATVQHSGSSVNPQRQRGPHAHSVNLAPDGKFLLVTDLGLDQVLAYKVDAAKGGLAPRRPAVHQGCAGFRPAPLRVPSERQVRFRH